MKNIVAREIEKFKREIESFFEKDETDLKTAETFFTQRISETVCRLLSACYEQKDAELLENKVLRREAGLVVERRNESRQVITQMGPVNYRRTYYAKREGGYSYPIDKVVGLEHHQRISSGVGTELVSFAREMSYAKASQVVTGSLVSKQTVMKKIREARPTAKPVVRRNVSVLHVDADEDHVKLQKGGNRIVPLVSIYEGVERQGTRGICKNVFHCSAFGKKPSDLWEEVLTELERRYDLTDTKVYLHGDGAEWIRQGLEWLPNSVFVLDRYHVNKALKSTVSGIERKNGSQYEHLFRQALQQGDMEVFCAIRDSLLERWPEREETIRESTDYLLQHFESIHRYTVDPEARNGGATEPHVSHVLSRRLSSRPMGWSIETLKKLVPILAGETFTLAGDALNTNVQPVPALAKGPSKRPHSSHTLGLVDPKLAAFVPARSGKVTPLFRLLQLYCR